MDNMRVYIIYVHGTGKKRFMVNTSLLQNGLLVVRNHICNINLYKYCLNYY